MGKGMESSAQDIGKTGHQDKANDNARARLRRFNYHGSMKNKLGLAFACLWLATPWVGAQTAAPEPAAPSGLAQAKAWLNETAPSRCLDSAFVSTNSSCGE